MLLVFGVEIVADRGHLAALEFGDPDGAPVFAGARHGGEHQCQHPPPTERMREHLGAPALLQEQALDVDLRFEATRRETANDDGAKPTTMSGAGSGRDGEGRSSCMAKAAGSVARGEQCGGRPPGDAGRRHSSSLRPRTRTGGLIAGPPSA